MEMLIKLSLSRGKLFDISLFDISIQNKVANCFNFVYTRINCTIISRRRTEVFKIELKFSSPEYWRAYNFFVIYRALNLLYIMRYISEHKEDLLRRDLLRTILPANCLFATVKRDVLHLATSSFRHLLHHT